jgi:murein peptide amidase A
VGRAAAAAFLVALALAPAAAASSEVVLGRSTEGRAIRAVRLGDPDSPRKVVVVGAIHGNEREGLRVTRRIRSLRVRGVDLWVVDSFNPDGLFAGTRQNARGVDLNRNFPYRWRGGGTRGDQYWSGPRPLSERESRVVRRWVLRIRPDVTIWYHQPWGVVLAPCNGPARVQRRYARRVGMSLSCRGAGLRGTATSWQNHRLPRSKAFVVELPPEPLARRAVGRHARAAAAAADR